MFLEVLLRLCRLEGRAPARIVVFRNKAMTLVVEEDAALDIADAAHHFSTQRLIISAESPIETEL